jgi:hypothetical protein
MASYGYKGRMNILRITMEVLMLHKTSPYKSEVPSLLDDELLYGDA